MTTTPLLALTLGDPTGIGPEVALACLRSAAVRGAARLVVCGPAELRPSDVPLVERNGDRLSREVGEGEALWLATGGAGPWRIGCVQREGGTAALAALRAGHELALAGTVEALVTAPVCKEALHLAGEKVEGQTELLGKWCGVSDHQMLAVVGDLRVLLLTRHMPLRAALDAITSDLVVRHLHILHRALGELGIMKPRIALAGLNPHAGEGGILGREEIDVLAPALERARADGLAVTGPHSPDTIFAAAAKGAYDGVLALYHDQAFIPIKLIGEGRAVTVITGLPYLRVSPAHGTAHDIAGKGIARADDLENAITQAATWAALRRSGGADLASTRG
jgi:4-hydroxythreonine-4-phosphate dehydrogenase